MRTVLTQPLSMPDAAHGSALTCENRNHKYSTVLWGTSRALCSLGLAAIDIVEFLRLVTCNYDCLRYTSMLTCDCERDASLSDSTSNSL